MGKNAVVLLPCLQSLLSEMGENIKLARLRRNLSAELVAQRAGISRATLWAVEKGSPSVAMGIYLSVLNAKRDSGGRPQGPDSGKRKETAGRRAGRTGP